MDVARKDIRQTPAYRAAQEFFIALHSPGFGQVTDGLEPAISPDGSQVAFTGQRRHKLEGLPESRICVADVATGVLRVITTGPNNDRLPRWSPGGDRLAFLSDRAADGQFQAYVLSASALGEAQALPRVEGTVEYHSWSPDGSRVLAGVAGLGADVAGGQGSGTTAKAAEDLPSWVPSVEGGFSDEQWRRAWVYDLEAGAARAVSRPGTNVWEAVWAGPGTIAAIVSPEPGEGAWYTAALVVIDVETGNEREVYRSNGRQLGLPCAPPSGNGLAVVEALCSDRLIVAGDVLLFGEDGIARRIDTFGVDVTQLLWTEDDRLVYLGVRGLETVAGEIHVPSGKAVQTWASTESCGVRYPEGSVSADGTLGIIATSFSRAPEVAVISDGELQTIASFRNPGMDAVAAQMGGIQEVRWQAPDGLEIEGLLCTPQGDGPYPTILWVHGGPVWGFRNRWLMGYQDIPLLISRGYAVFFVNPRGSSGRGQEFVEAVYGDMGGADTHDYLSGLDHLVERGIADPDRLGVTGGSYGGFMSAWLVTQTDRFKAAVPIAPVINWYSQHHTSNIPYFDEIFLADNPRAAGGRYHERSPVMHADQVRTPCLNIAGSLDRCTPPTQAMEFHRALRDNGVESVLVIYPEEGHGVRAFPAVIDSVARELAWFDRLVMGSPAAGNDTLPPGL